MEEGITSDSCYDAELLRLIYDSRLLSALDVLLSRMDLGFGAFLEIEETGRKSPLLVPVLSGSHLGLQRLNYCSLLGGAPRPTSFYCTLPQDAGSFPHLLWVPIIPSLKNIGGFPSAGAHGDGRWFTMYSILREFDFIDSYTDMVFLME